MNENPTLVTQLLECIRNADNSLAAHSLQEFLQHFGLQQETVDDYVRVEQQRIAANQVSIGNLITSMRLISALDWTLFFERVSTVEEILRQDPSRVYERMDFASRDQYRHAVEAIAKRLREPETKVATAAIDCARAAERAEETDLRRRHVGYFLIDDGRLELEAELRYRPSLKERLSRSVRRQATAAYLGGIALPSCFGALAVSSVVHFYGYPTWATGLTGLIALLPASELAIGLVNFLVTSSFKPRQLPKLQFQQQIPAAFQTLVVMPALLTSEPSTETLLEKLEIHFLANSEPGLRFAVLVDFVDAPREEMPGDAGLCAALSSEFKPSTRGMPTPTSRGFFCSTGDDAGIQEKTSGWGGNANAANCLNSIACCAEPLTPAM